jgi:MinD superfamily P-loop ATPase
MGVLEAGPTPTHLFFARGVMNVGEPMAVPIIRQLKTWELEEDGGCHTHPNKTTDWDTIILDAPPGTSCPVVETVHGADFVLLVTEPTPFGLHDLRLMVEVVRELDIPGGVVINRDGTGNAEVDQFCAQVDLPVLMRIPLDRAIGAGIAQGKPLVAIRPEYIDRFRDLYRQIQDITRGTGG